MGKGLPGGRRQAGALTIGSNRGGLSPQIDHGARAAWSIRGDRAVRLDCQYFDSIPFKWITQWILPCRIDRTERPVDHSHFDGVSFAAC